VESPSLEIFQPCLDVVLCSLVWVTLLGQGVGLGNPQIPAGLGFGDHRKPRIENHRTSLLCSQRCGAVQGRAADPPAGRGKLWPCAVGRVQAAGFHRLLPCKQCCKAVVKEVICAAG